MRQTYLPSTDSELLYWSGHFARGVAERAEELGISPQRAAALVAAQQAFAAAMALLGNSETRTSIARFRKNERREELKAAVRPVAELIQANADVSDEQRQALGLTIRKRGRSRIGRPTEAPSVWIADVRGTTVTVVLRQEVAGRRGRPAGATGALIYAIVSPAAAADPSPEAWPITRFVTETTASITFDGPPGSVVYVTARWVNRRAEGGPLADTVSAHLQFGWDGARFVRAAA